ncbi:hypothetical protein AVEN_228002-1 [Araneus ventricosus]|uniref:Uncharacterized protein n=1 Tax=Araneus ventricosus TaxID=182803 RepID=A0A4Y2X1Z3_ARAVE|nr:hypothetical protein AVEN_228002-1 [Araneus ventricosus]
MPVSGNACARKGRSETWQFAKNKFWSDFVRKQTFRESRQVLLRKRMSMGFEFVLILQTTRGSNFGLLATEVYLTSFIILVFSTCVRSTRESLGETTPAGFRFCATVATSSCIDITDEYVGPTFEVRSKTFLSSFQKQYKTNEDGGLRESSLYGSLYPLSIFYPLKKLS